MECRIVSLNFVLLANFHVVLQFCSFLKLWLMELVRIWIWLSYDFSFFRKVSYGFSLILDILFLSTFIHEFIFVKIWSLKTSKQQCGLWLHGFTDLLTKDCTNLGQVRFSIRFGSSTPLRWPCLYMVEILGFTTYSSACLLSLSSP